MKYSMTVVFLLLFAVSASALQIGDGYNNDTYNGHAYSQSDNAFLTMQAKSSGVPVGTVISWPIASMPEDAENWLECDGRAVPSNYELAKFMTHTPDYRGQFLRGVGGKAGALGAVQKESVHISKSNGIKIQMENVRRGRYTYKDSYVTYSFSGDDASDPRFTNINGTTGFYADNSGNALGFSSGIYEIPIEIKSPQEETRPENKAVRYLIRAQ